MLENDAKTLRDYDLQMGDIIFVELHPGLKKVYTHSMRYVFFCIMCVHACKVCCLFVVGVFFMRPRECVILYVNVVCYFILFGVSYFLWFSSLCTPQCEYDFFCPQMVCL